MKQFVNLVLLLSLLLCLNAAETTGQKRRKQRKPATPICSLADVSKGLVVVGYKSNAACSSGKELLVKRAENGDIVCAGSPLPAGFSVFAEAQGPMVGSCPDRAFLINDAPAVPSTLSAEALKAKCDAEKQQSIDRSIANKYSDELAVWLASATETICRKQGGAGPQ